MVNLFYWNACCTMCSTASTDSMKRQGTSKSTTTATVASRRCGSGNAQDGADVGERNNAKFATPPDGVSPAMSMYLWNTATPMLDGDLDNGIIVHEYGHGLSNRLVGGPSNTACLDNAEQMGEGWSDYLTLMFTMSPGDVGPTGRGIGTYALAQPTTGPGIRAFPYSTDLGVDPRTYDDIKTAVIPHGVGSTWTSMLWEMTWSLIDEHGFDPDLAGGDGGNNRALQLVVDGLKLTPCSPGFVDGRNAILDADLIVSGGANRCLIWKAFAKRGLGFGAVQGSTSSVTDGSESFDLPPSCRPLILTKSAPSEVTAGAILPFVLSVTNNDAVVHTDISVVDDIPTGTSLSPGSLTCPASVDAGVLTWELASLDPGVTEECAYSVLVDPAPSTTTLFGDDFEDDLGSWIVSHGEGSIDWSLVTTAARSGATSAFAADPAVVTDQYLTLGNAVPIEAATQLSFWHRYATEQDFDGAVVELSTDDGATWTDAGPLMTTNVYNGILNNVVANPLAGRPAYTGTSSGFVKTVVDLTSLSGASIKVRFRFASDASVGATGWWIDDIHIGDIVSIDTTATATSAQGASSASSTATTVLSPPATPRCNGLEVTVDLAVGQQPTEGDDVILGSPDADLIEALGGDDVICGGGGDDTVVGGDGNDWIDGGSGDDTIFGQDETTITGGPGRPTASAATPVADTYGGSDSATDEIYSGSVPTPSTEVSEMTILGGSSGYDLIDGG
ncbi:MAG: M36 family metallopeptidase [Acidimicrobiales bacterium]